MRKPNIALAVLLGLTISASPARADEDDTITVKLPVSMLSRLAQDDRTQLYRITLRQRERARAMRNGGIATTIVGAVMSVIGAPLMYFNLGLDDNPRENSALRFSLGAAMVGLGQGAVVTGIPIWAAGGARMQRADRALLTISPASLQGQF